MEHYSYKKIIFLSDIHLGVKKNSNNWIDINDKYFDDFLIPFIEDNADKDTCLFILGDVFENRSLLNIKVGIKALNLFKRLNKLIPTFCLVGNHDIYNVHDNNVCSVDLLESSNIKIYKKPTEITMNNTKFMVLPWVHDKKDIEELVARSKSKYLLCHMDINGLTLNKAQKIDFGVDTTLLSKFKNVFSGHIHLRQEVKNVVMVGNPYSTTFNDVDNQKGIYVLDTDTHKYTFYPNNVSHIHLDIDFDNYLNDKKTFISKVNGNFVRMTVKQSYIYDNPNNFNKGLKDIADNVNELQIVITDDTVDDYKKEKEIYNKAKTIEDVIVTYIDSSELNKEDKLEMESEILTIINDIKNADK